MKKKEATVIGAGLAGLTAGISLAREGYRVTIKEKFKCIGGSPDLHPSVHTTPAQLDELWNYLGFGLENDFVPCNPYPGLYLKSKKLKLPPYVKYNRAYCIERGPRPSSIDSSLMSLAKKSGVRFDFGAAVDLNKLKENTIVATGLFPSVYTHFGIDQRKIYGKWTTREIQSRQATGDIYMGPFATFYGYTACANGLDYNLLFSEKPLTEKDLDRYKTTLERAGVERYPDQWRDVIMSIPAEARLFSKGMIMAGTLSGMIEPFWGYGIVGALISGRLAAKAVINREEALRDFRSFTAGFARKFNRRERFASMPYSYRSVLTRAGLLAMRLKCALNRDLASGPREPLRWFKEDPR